jgi:predicted O-linked N-acetylglucosamine transferase (SPINDLY family)
MPAGQLRLGALASPNKLSEATIGLWADVLQALPQAGFSLKHQAWSDPRLCDWLRARFAAKGIEARRLNFVDTRAESDYLGFLASVDLLLDSFPYGGALSSCDAAWMGVPVLGLRGGQRIAESFWASLGQPDLLANDREDFVARACALASPEALAPWRSSLRQRLLASALCDGRRQARECEAALRARWIDWAGRQG